MSVRQLTQRIRKPGDPARIATAEALEQIQASLDELKSDLDAIVAGTTSIEGLLSIPEYGLRGVSVSSVVPTYADADDNGDIDVILTVTYSPPSPIDTFDRVLVFVEKPTGEIIPIGEFLYPETAGGGSDSFEFFLPPPTVQEQWRVYLVSGSPSYVNELVLYGQLNASPSYLVTVDPIPEGASGSEWAPNVTSPSATVEYAIDQVGGLMWRVYGSFTPPSDPEYRGVRIVGRDPGGKDHQLSVEPYNATAYISSWRQVPDTSESWTIYFQSIAPNGRLNTIVPGTTPSANVTVQDQTSLGGLKLNRVDGGTFDTSEFEIAGGGPGVFRMKIINADKIQTGTLKVGGGGSKPGQLGVFDGIGSMVAWAGQNGSYYGIWGKQLWVGGTDPSNAPLYVDSGGDVVLETVGSYHPQITLNNNGITTEILNVYDSGFGQYAGIRVTDNTTSQKAGVSKRGLEVYYASSNLSGFYGPDSFDIEETNGGRIIGGVDSDDGHIWLYGDINANAAAILVAGANAAATGVSFPYGGNVWISGSAVIDSSRDATFNSLDIDAAAGIDASGNIDGASIDVSGNSDANAFRINGVTVIDSSRNISGASLDVSGNCEANAFRVNTNQIVDSSRNADFVTLKIGGQTMFDSSQNLTLTSGEYLKVHLIRCTNYVTSGSPASAATHKIPVYDGTGTLLNYIYLYP